MWIKIMVVSSVNKIFIREYLINRLTITNLLIVILFYWLLEIIIKKFYKI
jgi:hypothetical protein